MWSGFFYAIRYSIFLFLKLHHFTSFLSKVGVPANLPTAQTNTSDDMAIASSKTAVFKGNCSPAFSM